MAKTVAKDTASGMAVLKVLKEPLKKMKKKKNRRRKKSGIAVSLTFHYC